jgi:hypothetical protein
MNTISIVSSVSAARADDHSLRVIALLACVGLIGSYCLTTLGVQVNTDWI